MTPKEALNLSFQCRDLDGEVTIRQYMQELLKSLFREGEGFSGKRPFGNSGWEDDLAVPLIAAGAIEGTLTCYNEDDEPVVYNPEDGDLEVSAEVADERQYGKYVQRMIAAL